jgi:hypothetical protein
VTNPERWRWAAASLPLAAAAACLYVFFEWLFFITKPSPTSALGFRDQLVVLAKSPIPVVLPLIAVQVVASVISIVRYPRMRGLAVVPAAIVGGVLLLVLVDNFTYTVLGFGMLTGGEVVRVAYSAFFAMCIAIAGRKIFATLALAASLRGSAAAGLLLSVLLTAAQLAAARPAKRTPGSSLPEVGGVSIKARTDLPNIFFLGIDGVDAAILSAYGYERPTTPFLERIAPDMLVFDNAFSNATRTHGSLVTLLTGRLPFSTRVTFPPTVLQGEDAHRHLPGILKGLGYSTLQIGMRHYADAEDANLLGFDAANYRWQNLDEVGPGQVVDEAAVFRRAVAERLDERLGRLFGLPPVASAFAHVEGHAVAPEWRDDRRVKTLERFFRHASEPWFVHLHLLDTHCCQYRPRQMRFSGGRTKEIDARDSQIVETDANVERLIEALQDSGRLDNTVVVISSDHTSQWKATERVPLMMRFPNAVPKGRVSTNVQLADVAPTMLAYLGVGIPAWMDGLPLGEPAKIPTGRQLFGVSDIGRREGMPGLRLLLESGPPNYGARSAMMISGSRWYELSLADGALTSGEVPGHRGGTGPILPDRDARVLIERRLNASGFRVMRSGQADSADREAGSNTRP